MRKRLSFANVISILALFAALGGTGYAAFKLPKNSVGTKQIRKHAVTYSKVSPGAARKLRGQRGPAGPVGPSRIYATHMEETTSDSVINVSENVGTLAVPTPGQYLVTAHVQLENDGAALNVVCGLSAGSGPSASHAAETIGLGNAAGDSQIDSIELQTTHTFAAAGSAVLSCRNATDSRTVLVRNVRIAALGAGTVTDTSFSGPLD